MAIDYTQAAGQVRLLISDLDEDRKILGDEEIAGYLARYGVTADGPATPRGPISRAAADALDAIASSETLVGKKIRTGDGLTTDGPAVAADLRKHAASLRALAQQEDEDDGLSGGYFGVAEFQPYPYPDTFEAAEALAFPYL